MKIKLALVGIFFLSFLQISSIAQTTIILKQKNLPIEITESSAKYYDPDDAIGYDIKFKNISNKKLVAIQFGFISIDVFNDFLSHFSGVEIKEFQLSKEQKEHFSHSPFNAYLFKNYGMGLIYVEAIRFVDGIIWKLDIQDILPQIQQIHAGFSVELMEKKQEIKK